MRRRLYAVRHTHGVGRVGRGARRVDTGAAAPAEYDVLLRADTRPRRAARSTRAAAAAAGAERASGAIEAMVGGGGSAPGTAAPRPTLRPRCSPAPPAAAARACCPDDALTNPAARGVCRCCQHAAARVPAVRGHSGHPALQAVPGKLLPGGARRSAASRHGALRAARWRRTRHPTSPAAAAV